MAGRDSDPFISLNRILDSRHTQPGSIQKACYAVEDCVVYNRSSSHPPKAPAPIDPLISCLLLTETTCASSSTSASRTCSNASLATMTSRPPG